MKGPPIYSGPDLHRVHGPRPWGARGAFLKDILSNLWGPRYRLDIREMLWAHHFGGPPLQWALHFRGPPVQGALHFRGPPVQGAHHFRSPSLYGATTQAAHFLCQIKKGPNCSKNCIYLGALHFRGPSVQGALQFRGPTTLGANHFMGPQLRRPTFCVKSKQAQIAAKTAFTSGPTTSVGPPLQGALHFRGPPL